MKAEAILEMLRTDLHKAIDEAVNTRLDMLEGDAISVEIEGPAFEEWTYTWPDGKEETYRDCEWYRVEGTSGRHRVLVGWTIRPVRGKDRRRIVVFGQQGGDASTILYPWTEFVETSDGRYAAIIPDPERPRATLRDGTPVPSRFRMAPIERTDHLYEEVSNAPTLRSVVNGDDVFQMIVHGYWVADLRGRL